MSAEAYQKQVTINKATGKFAKNIQFGAPEQETYHGWAGSLFKRDLNKHVQISDKLEQAIKSVIKKTKGDPSIIRKADFDTTVGQYFIPLYLDPDVVRLTQEETPFLALLRRRTMIGLTANIQTVTALPASAYEAEAAVLTEEVGTYDRLPYTAKYLYSIGKVTGQAQAATRTYNPAMSQDMIDHALSFRIKEEQSVLVGESTDTTSSFYTYNQYGFDGEHKILAGYDTGSNQNDINDASIINLTDVRAGIKEVKKDFGRPSLVVTDLETYEVLKNAITQYTGFVNQSINIAWGLQTYSIDGVPVIWTHTLPTTDSDRSALICDMRMLEMHMLLDVTQEPLAKTDDADKYMIKDYGVYVDRSGGKKNYSIVGGSAA